MENKKINIAELLKDCPKGMELDCILFKDTPVYLHEVITDTNYPIEIKVEYPCKELETFFLNKYGAIYDRTTANCVIFPKGKTTWEGFLPSKFKDGDVVAVTMIPESAWIGIFKQYEETSFESHCCLNPIGEFSSKGFKNHSLKGLRFASEEEKQRLFQSVKENGYKWNPETKTLEKLIQPKFKVGDIIRKKGDYISGTVTEIDIDYFYKVIYDGGAVSYVNIEAQNDWELVPNKFNITTLKPFESRVLVRDTVKEIWKPDFFGCLYDSNDCPYMVVGGIRWKYCIPYKGNEHLLGKTDDCDEFYKNWKE